jgi:hypothetical protein
VSAVKFAATSKCVQLLEGQTAIHKQLKHPLILEFRGHFPEWTDPMITTKVTEVAENGSLANSVRLQKG